MSAFYKKCDTELTGSDWYTVADISVEANIFSQLII